MCKNRKNFNLKKMCKGIKRLQKYSPKFKIISQCLFNRLNF